MTPKNGSNGSEVDGNTKSTSKRLSPSKHWVFTLNNWVPDEKDAILLICNNGSIVSKFVFQAEQGEEGTPHLQGYIEFVSKCRPAKIFFPRIHWEVSRNVKASIAYCFKEDDTYVGPRWTNIKIAKPITVLSDDQLYDWQRDIIDIILCPPDDRKIYWFWEEVGNIGKSCFCKYLAVKHDALVLSGKGSDCKYAIVKWFESKGYYPELIIYDIPRTVNDFISYEALESIKNGVFFSNKYESSQVIMNCPHILCFSNQEPSTYKMSLDRWVIRNLR